MNYMHPIKYMHILYAYITFKLKFCLYICIIIYIYILGNLNEPNEEKSDNGKM